VSATVRRKKSKSELDMWSLYVYSMKSPVTKQKYQRSLERWLDFVGVKGDGLETKAKAFAAKGQKDNTWAFNKALDFLRYQKERVDRREVTGATVRNYVKSMKLFCEIADVPIIWSKLTRGLPRGKRYSDDRIPSVDELKKLCEYPDRRIKAIIYTMISSGIRLGSWDYIRWSSIIPIKQGDDIVAAKIIVYEGESEEYYSFIVPSAYNELKKWMDFRAMSGEAISGESWVMRDLWDTSVAIGRGMVTMPKKLSSSGIKRLIERAIWAQGLRTKLQNGKKRHPYQAVHSLRKFFKTRCELAGMKPINIETLLSHSTGISDSYFRPTYNELFQDYLGVTRTLSLETTEVPADIRSQFDQLAAEIATLKKKIK
jgi:integrase